MKHFSTHFNITVAGKHHRPVLVDAFVPASEGIHPVIIFSHGFKGFKDWGPFNQVAALFATAGFTFVKFNFSWNGTTPDAVTEFTDLEAFGNNNFSKELDDLDTVLNWVHDQADTIRADLSKISLVGHSRGGAITILKAAEDDRVRSLATWGAVADFTRFVSRHDIAEWKRTGVLYVENSRTGQRMPLYLQLYFDFVNNRQRFHILSAAARLKKPLLLIHGTNDETVPVSQAEELYRLNPAMVRLLKLEGANHTFGTEHPYDKPELPDSFRQVVEKTLQFMGFPHR